MSGVVGQERVSVDPPGAVGSDAVSFRLAKDQDRIDHGVTIVSQIASLEHDDGEDAQNIGNDHEDNILEITNEGKYHLHYQKDVATRNCYGYELDIERGKTIAAVQYFLHDDVISESTTLCRHQLAGSMASECTHRTTNIKRNGDIHRDGNDIVTSDVRIPTNSESTATDSSPQDSGSISEAHKSILLAEEGKSFLVKLLTAAFYLNIIFAASVVSFALSYHHTPSANIAPSLAPSLAPTLSPTSSPVRETTFSNTNPVILAMRPIAPATAPTPVDLPNQADEESKASLLAILVPLVIAFEVSLLGVLSLIYRKWKRRPSAKASSRSNVGN